LRWQGESSDNRVSILFSRWHERLDSHKVYRETESMHGINLPLREQLLNSNQV